MITINDEVAVISGGGGGGGGINSSDTPGKNASANKTISTTLKVAPAKKKLVINYSPNIIINNQIFFIINYSLYCYN